VKPDVDEDSFSDEVNREDGLERYWLFYNGEWAEAVCGLAGAMGGVFWGFLYILGYGQTALGYALGAIAIIGLVSLRLLNKRIRDYAE
jgi:hypothetical protein